ncbi:MAG: hypothetical protein ACC618_01935, partial [Patescibacteria group bacterium]
MRLLLLSIFAFILTSTSALSIYKVRVNSTVSKNTLVVNQILTKKYTSESFAELPTLKSTTSYPVISAQAAVATDINSGVTLYEKNPDKPL